MFLLCLILNITSEDSSPRHREREDHSPDIEREDHHPDIEREDSSHRVRKVGGSQPNLDYLILETLMTKRKINTLINSSF